jgi:hypothetical protein
MLKHTIAIVTIAIATACIFSCTDKKYNDPKIFENAINQFEHDDSLNFPPKGAIIVIGSSSMRGWHETIRTDLAPLTIIPRGFGGSNMNDALYYADRIVLTYEPRAVVIYEGDNDIAQGVSPSKIADTFIDLVKKIHIELPQCRIYFLSIKPSISRWKMWGQMEEANGLIAKECAKDNKLMYVDVASVMLNESAKPKEEIFLADNLHMNKLGYEIWTTILKPILLEAELRYE